MDKSAAFRPSWFVGALLLSVALATAAVHAQDKGKTDSSQCQRCGAGCCKSTQHSRWISVPMYVTETRYHSHVVKEIVDREETYTVFRRVPVERQYFREEMYLEDEIKTKTITEKQCYMVNNPVERTIKVPVPEYQYRQSPCGQGGCKDGGACQAGCSQNCPVIVLGEQEIQQTCQQPDIAFSKTTREMDYCVKTPKTRKVPCATETVYKLEPVEKTRTVSVCVPKLVKTPYEVTVLRTVPQLVACCEHCAWQIDRQQQREESPRRNRDEDRGQALEKLREHLEALKEKDRALLGNHR